jgi:glucokinase
MSDFLFGIDLGGTNVKFVALDGDGRELGRSSTSTQDTAGANLWRDGIRCSIEALELRFGRPRSIGLCAPGLARQDNRAIASMPGRLQGLEDFDWTEYLGRPVYVTNDAHAALAAEAWLGAASGFTNALMLTLGTGVGGAILVNGRVLQGSIGRAGHFGHTCLDMDGAPDIARMPGSIEDFIGECTVARRTGGRFGNTRDLVRAYEAGDEFAAAVWLRSIRALGCTIASLINILDPDGVILGGGISGAGPSLFGPLSKVLDEVEWRPGGHAVPILPAQLGDYAGAIGAARIASFTT